MSNEYECFTCKKYRRFTAGTCDGFITKNCLGYDRDPRGRLIQERVQLTWSFTEPLREGTWTNNLWETHTESDDFRKRYIYKIHAVDYDEEKACFWADVTCFYFEFGDQTEQDAANTIKFKNYLKKQGIHNVLLLHKKEKTKSKF